MASVAHDLDVSDQMIYSWRKQDRITSQLAGIQHKIDATQADYEQVR